MNMHRQDFIDVLDITGLYAIIASSAPLPVILWMFAYEKGFPVTDVIIASLFTFFTYYGIARIGMLIYHYHINNRLRKNGIDY